MNNNFININSPQIDFSQHKYIMLDTCTIMELFKENNDIVDFVKRAGTEQVVFCYSIKSMEELHIMVEKQNIPDNKRQAENNMMFHIKKSQEQVKRIIDKINKIPNMYTEPIGNMDYNLYLKAKETEKEYKLRWGDAVICTIAKENNINSIVTFDKDFKCASNDLVIFKGNKR